MNLGKSSILFSSNCKSLNNVKIASDSYYAYSLQENRFKFFNNNFTVIYIHENGYINFTKEIILIFQILI